MNESNESDCQRGFSRIMFNFALCGQRQIVDKSKTKQ